MAVSSNRSPSPSPASTRPNPSSRNSELNNAVRRSFSGNPFTKPSIVANTRGFTPVTPANSPSDFPRRHSMGKESRVPSHYYDKENEKEQNAKPVKTRSPTFSKGTKNFMSPTISTASKMAASPRKKVLLEKNEQVRTSFSSFPDGKSPLSSMNPQEANDNSNSIDQTEACLLTPSPLKASNGNGTLNFHLPLNSKNESLSETITEESASVIVDLCSKHKHSPSPASSSILAPVDVDPSLPPYDPKKNFLSPRPQFLHYKPNPRIGSLLNKEKERNQVEDSFISESFSDAETSEETQSEDLQRDSEDDSSVELMKEQNEEVEEREEALAAAAKEQSNLSEPIPISIQTSNGTVEAKEASTKSQSYLRLKPISFLLFLLVACLSVTISESPVISSVIDSSVYKDSSLAKFYDPAEFAALARTNFVGLARNFRLWSTKTMSYLAKMIPMQGESDELGFWNFGNFNASSEDIVGGGYLLEENRQNGPGPMRQKDVGISQSKKHKNPETEAYEQNDEASPKPESEKADLALQTDVIVPDGSELVQIQEECHVSHMYLEQTSQNKSEVEANLNLQAEVVDNEPENIATEKEEEVQVSQVSKIKPEFPGDDRPRGADFRSDSPESEASITEIEPSGAVLKSKSLESEGSIAEVEFSRVVLHPESEASIAEVEYSGAVLKSESPESEGSIAEVEFSRVVLHSDNPESEASSAEVEYSGVVLQSESPESEASIAEVEYSGVVLQSESLESEASTANSPSLETLYRMLRENLSDLNTLAISLLILILTVAAAFIIVKQQKSPSPGAAAIPIDHLLAKKLISIPTASVENTNQDRLYSRHWPTEVDMTGEPCPSEMSSIHRSSSYSKKGSKAMVDEPQSQEKSLGKSYKRESFASSSEYSIGSPSYGSFTSFEKIHSKHGCGEEEVVTPVRRSSRIRKQQNAMQTMFSSLSSICSNGKKPLYSINLQEVVLKIIQSQRRFPLLRSFQREAFLVAPSPFKASNDNEIHSFHLPQHSKNNSNFLSETKPSPTSSPAIPAQIDAEPSTTPYDPKTNYLCPRPQFRHYKPNRRIRSLLKKEREVGWGGREGGKQLKNSFPYAESTEETHSEVQKDQPLNSKNVSESLSETKTMETDSVNVDVCSKTKPIHSSTSILAPLDTDPSLPPYDPKTNYLCPRPQFRYYKPNLRIQRLKEEREVDWREREGKQLEYCFNSESSSDAESSYDAEGSSDAESNEETESEDLHKYQLLNSKNVSGSLSETITKESDSVNVDVCSKTKPSPSPSTSTVASLDTEPSLPPYDPKTNYLCPRPQFLYYKPNPRIKSLLNKAREVDWTEGENKLLNNSLVSESFSDAKSTEETQSEDLGEESENDSSVALMTEEQNGEVGERGEAVAVEAEEEFNVSEPNPISVHTSNGTVEAKGIFMSQSYFRLKPISWLLLLLVAFLSIPVTDSPVLSSAIDSSVCEDSSFTKFYDPAERARTNFVGLAWKFMFWSTNNISHLSKTIPMLRELDELGYWHFGNFMALYEDVVGAGNFVEENRGNVLGSMRQLEVGISLTEEQRNRDIKAKSEDANLALQAEAIEPGISESGQIQEEYHASDTHLEQASQGKPEVKEANLNLQSEVIEPNNSGVQKIQEEGGVFFHIHHEPQIIIAEKEQEVEVSWVAEINAESNLILQAEAVEPNTLEVEQIQEGSNVTFHNEHGPQIIVAEKEQELEVSEVAEIKSKPNLNQQAEVVEPNNSEMQQNEVGSIVAFHSDHGSQIIRAEMEQEVQVPPVGEIKPEPNLSLQSEISETNNLEMGQIQEGSKVPFHIDHELQNILAEKEHQVQVSQFAQAKSEMLETRKLHDENDLNSHAEVESSRAVLKRESPGLGASISEIESNGEILHSETPESEASTGNSPSLEELYPTPKEKLSDLHILATSSLILILTVAAALIHVKQQRSPSPGAAVAPMDHFLAKKLTPIPTASVERTNTERLSSGNWPTEVDLRGGEPCSSEMSSPQGSSSFSKNRSKVAVNRAQKQERVPRKSHKRDSLSSSTERSISAASYGSFTSYEKIRKKHGCEEEEVVVPVRRSSRIRNQVATSRIRK